MWAKESFKVKSNISMRKYGYDIKKNILQYIYDFLFFPLRCVLPYRWLQYIKLTDLGRERRRVVIPYLKGKILDVGCGPLNELRNEYRNGQNIVNTDIFQWSNVNVICSAELSPFRDESFDIVLMLACLNHIKDRNFALREAYRVLKRDGRILITMINPLVGFLVHKFVFWFDYDRNRKMDENETYGLSGCYIVQLLDSNGFKDIKVIPFLYGLNKLFIARK